MNFNMDAKESLLKAALKVFSANGYHGSSVADIAKEAKVSKALFYHYFESKNELLVIFAKQRLEEWIPLLENLETIQHLYYFFVTLIKCLVLCFLFIFPCKVMEPKLGQCPLLKGLLHGQAIAP